MKRGLLAEYTSKDALLVAIHVMRARGFTKLEAFTPYSVKELDEALGRRRSPIAIAAGFGAAFGAAGACFLQWLAVAYLYPTDVGARPPYMPLPFLIITIEMGFLVGGVAAFVATILLGRLTRLWDPVFEVEGFASATRDGFWLGVSADDPQWDATVTNDVLVGTGPRAIHAFGGIG